MNETSLLPVILCGGTGSRLWPLSRSSFPKQYLSLFDESKNSLLQETQYRLKNLINIGFDKLLIESILSFVS